MEENTASFETKLEQLEKIVSQLESGDIPLENMVSLYEKGKVLYEDCSKILSSYEKRLMGEERND